MLIRQESRADADAVYALVKEAFASAEESDGTEQDLITALRDSPAFVPELALVAEKDGRVVGHILFTKIGIGHRVELALAPLAVDPAYQRQGVGQALMAEGHKRAAALGYSFCVVLGSACYYQKAGYVSASRYGITAPLPVPDENYMALSLRGEEHFPGGAVSYAKEFGIG